MLPNPRPFDGYIEQPVRVSSTALIHFQRNRYSVPNELAHRVISLRIYPERLQLVADGQASGELIAGDVRQLAMMLLATMQGIAVLANNKMLDPLDGQAAIDAVDLLLTGLTPRV